MARNSLAHAEPYLWDGRYLKLNDEFVHRQVWKAEYGSIPEGALVHHKNGDRGDNRLDNLELLTKAEHCRLHNPRLGTAAVMPPRETCESCGGYRNEREMRSDPRRKVCNHCRAIQNRMRLAR